MVYPAMNLNGEVAGVLQCSICGKQPTETNTSKKNK